MKIKTIRCITYCTFILGALIMLLAIALPVLSDYLVAFMYIGGTIGVLGMVFCLLFLRCQPCPGCRDFMIIQGFSSIYCPCCNERFN